MNQAYLDPNSYTFAGGFTVSTGKDLVIHESLQRSQTMLIKWQIRQLAKGATIDRIPAATFSAVLEIPGLGHLRPTTYQIDPSIQGDERVQIISLDPTLPYKFTFSQTSELVTNSVLEFYTSNIAMGDFNNPVNVTTDLSPIVAAITASSAAEVAATQAQTAAATRQVRSETESNYTATVWSNVPSNHIAVPPDSARMGGSFYNTGNKPLAIDKFVDIATKTAAMQAGTYNFKPEEAGMGYLIYSITAGGTATAAINLQK
jgi:hypothetical protein